MLITDKIPKNWVFTKRHWKNVEELIIFLKLSKAYEHAAGLCDNKRVLDFGCGSGYGTVLLSDFAEEATGVDVNPVVIEYCSKEYQKNNLTFEYITTDLSTRFEDKSFDTIISFQVIEHIPDVKKYLEELKRLLSDKGRMIITTPNKHYRLLPFQQPWNREHIREYSPETLKKEIEKVFDDFEIFSIHGTDEVNRIEHGRVRQKPIRVYLTNPIKKFRKTITNSILKLILPGNAYDNFQQFRKDLRKKYKESIKKLLKGKISKKETGLSEEIIGKYSTADFMVDKDLDKALDFMVIINN